jgi:hypothetical protein
LTEGLFVDAEGMMRAGSMPADEAAPFGLGVLRAARLVQLLAILHADMGNQLRAEDAEALRESTQRWRDALGGLLAHFGTARSLPRPADPFARERLAEAGEAIEAGDTARLLAQIRHIEAEAGLSDVRGPLIEAHVLNLARLSATGDRAALAELAALARHVDQGGEPA